MGKKQDSSSKDSMLRSLAIDGPTAAGKSVIGKKLSQRLSLYFCDTGLMYRAATLAVLRSEIILEDESGIVSCVNEAGIDLQWTNPEIPRVLLQDIDVSEYLRDPRIEHTVSRVAGIQAVREVLVQRQKAIARRSPVIMVGRDIGKVILPEARVKIFLDASLAERARRRFLEQSSTGQDVTLKSVEDSISRRDSADNTGHRSITAEQAADGAVIITTDGLSEDTVVEKCLAAYRTGNA